MGVTAAVVKTERPIQPRVLEIIFAAVELIRVKRWDKTRWLRQVVPDCAHDFFNAPTRPDERKFFATRLKQAIYVWLRAVQGSRGAPLICGRALALAMRLVASLLEDGVMNAGTYVDDPLISFMGNQEEQYEAMGLVIGGLLAMGYELAFAKAQDSNEDEALTWTVARLTVLHEAEAIKAEVKEDILIDLSEDIQHMFA